MTSTERDSRNSPSGPAPSLFGMLASANNFSREELEMNRVGQFSDLQKKRLLRKSLEFAALFFGSVLLVLVPVASKLRDLSLGSVVLYLSVFVIFLFGFGWKAVTIFVDLWNQKVISVQCPVMGLDERTRYSHGRSYFSTTGTHRFSVSEKAFHALVPQIHYRIFYALQYGTGLPEAGSVRETAIYRRRTSSLKDIFNDLSYHSA